MSHKLKYPSWSSVAVIGALVASGLPLGCSKDQPTGYLLKVSTESRGMTLPDSLVVSVLRPGGFAVENLAFPDPETRKSLSYRDGNNLATVVIDVDGDFEKPRRLWIRARQAPSKTLGEYAGLLPAVEEGKQIEVPVVITWNRLKDSDNDEVPDAVDDCPMKADKAQDGNCDAESPDAANMNAVDAAIH
jgi:hypothetical protein